ncbi:MAG: SIS domain-containing protein [Candidatus Eremiobacteraeota bacterium]|nr:SIS domain-containing protein [Candidatus Eremiobacteraeota bacterium]MBV8366783.1 SIS domain-containing protein [Candidatus Eremiobacteraeota bacterium]
MAERAGLWREGEYEAPVNATVEAIVAALRRGGRVFFFGNGGSAAQAQHLAAEFSGRFMLERPGYAGLALTVDTSALTAIANDYGFERIFARQLEGLAHRGDVAIGITTSGKSPNVIEGLKTARARGATTVALSGNGGGPAAECADIAIVGPSGPSWKVQEVQFALGHIICELAEAELARS